MSWSLDIGTIAGTVVRVHITFLLFLGWIFVASWVSGGAAAAWQGLAFLLLLFACVLAHEFGHIFTARVRRLDAGRDAAADRRRGTVGTHSREAVGGIPGGDRRPAGERRDRDRAGLPRRRTSQHRRS